MGRRNFLVDGGSGTGKTAVCEELLRRGYQAIHGDRELAYQGDPVTGAPRTGMSGVAAHHHHLWDVDRVRTIVADHREDVTFFCGGSRNTAAFIYLFDGVFVLHIDTETLTRRLDQRPPDEWAGHGRHAEQELTMRLHANETDIPREHVVIDATQSLTTVLNTILTTITSPDTQAHRRVTSWPGPPTNRPSSQATKTASATGSW